ncbi:hypothetical protein F4779DRAFT_573326 [Xylariaceae sp. FL0662B]|nr:hypothetical protein F4779DRAFT_573326 [Xylariaceae sp. FL0662B]
MEFIVLTGPNTAASRCSFWGPGPDILPQIPLTACSNLNVSFSFGRQQAYYPLSITESLAPGQNRTGTYQIPQYDVAVEDHGSVDTERYEGPSDLTVSNVTTVSF